MNRLVCLICSYKGPGLHRFPRNEKRLQEWLVAIKRSDLLETEHGSSVVYDNGRLCNRHFTNSCFIGRGKKRLAKHAIPHLSDAKPPKSSLEKKQSTLKKKQPTLEEKQSTSEEMQSTSEEMQPTLEKDSGKKQSTPEKKQECDVTQDDNSDGSEKRSCTISKTSVELENSASKREQDSEIPCSQPATFENGKQEGDIVRSATTSMIQALKDKKEPERVIGASKVGGELILLVKWKDDDDTASFLPSTFLRKHFPDILIQFYEEKLMWAPSTEDKNETTEF